MVSRQGGPNADQANLVLRSLEVFGVAFFCYDAHGRPGYRSRSAAGMQETGAIDDATTSRMDRLIAQQLSFPKPCLQLGRFALACEMAVSTSASIAIYLARPALGDVAAVAVMRPELAVRRQNETLGLLSDREQTVAQLISAGFSTKEIASRLGISPHTARHHTEHVFTKLGVRSRAAVAALCVAN